MKLQNALPSGEPHHNINGMKIGFIGCGKMATALARGAVGAELVRPVEIMASGLESDTAAKHAFLGALSHENGAPAWTADNTEVVRFADLCVIAVKPQHAAEALAPIKPLAEGKVFLSIMAGVPISGLTDMLGTEAKIIRSMPNTPMQVGAGASVYAPGPNLGIEEVAPARDLLAASGNAWRVDEGHIDAVTALSGSGPAYVYHFIQGLIDGGEELGLDRKLARDLAVQTVLGAAQMVESHIELSPLELASHVKSPGGTTLAGCEVLEQGGFEPLVRQAMAAAKKRAEELAEK